MATKTTNPDNVVTLSTGVEVRFMDLSNNQVQDLVLSSFSGMNLNKLDEQDILQHGDKFLRYNTTLIQDGVRLVNPLKDEVAKLGLSDNWIKKLLRSGKVLDKELYDLNDVEDQEILFLRYYGFQSEEDFQLLTEKLLGNSG